MKDIEKKVIYTKNKSENNEYKYINDEPNITNNKYDYIKGKSNIANNNDDYVNEEFSILNRGEENMNDESNTSSILGFNEFNTLSISGSNESNTSSISEFIEEKIEQISDIHILEGECLAYREKMNIYHSNICVRRHDIEKFLIEIEKNYLTKQVYEKFNLDFSFKCSGYRFRGNIFLNKGKIGLALRKINDEILGLEDLKLPSNIINLCDYSSGIIFITGPTGSGKSTTMASLIEYINKNKMKHILTIEDPIEQEFVSKKSFVNQREVGSDVDTFLNAIKMSLRQDPDIIVIGEIRDAETMKVAINAAETGHLCISTLHTLGAVNSIERVIGMFKNEEKEAIRYELSLALKSIVSQQLIKDKNGEIIPVVELMIGDKSIANMIKENKVNQISNYIMTNSSKGMISMDKSLIELYRQKKIDKTTLLEKAIDKDYIQKNVGVTDKKLF